MDIEGTVNKFLNPVEKYGEVIGVAAALLPGWQYLASSIENMAQGQIHAPEWTNWINSLFTSNNVTALGFAVGGWFLKDGLKGSWRTLAEIAQKVGTGYFGLCAAANFLFFMTHSPAPNPVQGVGTGSTLNQRAHMGNRTTNYTGRPTAGSGYTGRAQQRMGN